MLITIDSLFELICIIPPQVGVIDYSHYLRDGNYVLQTSGDDGDEYVVHTHTHTCNTVKPLYKVTPEMKTPPLIRTL